MKRIRMFRWEKWYDLCTISYYSNRYSDFTHKIRRVSGLFTPSHHIWHSK